jgi:toxin ParE1/3/4
LKPITYHPEARAEADESAAFYHVREPQAARDFIDDLAFVQAEIECAPDRWPFEIGTQIQRIHFPHFPFTVFYQDDLHEVYILAVAHTSRRPGYWKKRIAPVS